MSLLVTGIKPSENFLSRAVLLGEPSVLNIPPFIGNHGIKYTPKIRKQNRISRAGSPALTSHLCTQVKQCLETHACFALACFVWLFLLFPLPSTFSVQGWKAQSSAGAGLVLNMLTATEITPKEGLRHLQLQGCFANSTLPLHSAPS